MANYQLNKTGAEIDEALDLAIQHERTKANIDGAYEGLTAGFSEQLVSSVTVEDKVPYNFRTSGGSADIGKRLTDKIVGGTLAWNQICSFGSVGGYWNIIDNSTIEAKITVPTQTSYPTFARLISGHRYLFFAKSDCSNTMIIYYDHTYVKAKNIGSNTESAWIYSSSTLDGGTAIVTPAGEIAVGERFMLNCFDLTQMFGTAIADYIYSLETANAGAGVAWFKKLFPKPYYAYNAGTLLSVNAAAHNTVGFNAWDEEWELGTLDNETGAKTDSANNIRSKNYIPVVAGATYYANCGGNYYMTVCFYDAAKNYLGYEVERNNTFDVPDGCHYILFRMESAYGTTYGNNLCVNISWDGERDGEYEAYNKHAYALDESLELRGIPKLGANNDLYYDGDVYESDGKVTRKYGVVDLGTLDWTKDANDPVFVSSNISGIVKSSSTPNSSDQSVFCVKYVYAGIIYQSGLSDKQIMRALNGYSVRIYDSAYSDAATFKTAMSGVYLVYELATPTEETADPFTNPQIVDDFGTEEYVDYAESQGTRDVAIPVGHDTEYQNNLRAKLEMSPDSPDGNGDYIVRQTNGINSYVPLVIPTELPTAPTTDGTYVLKATVADGVVTYSWEAQA